MVLKMVACSVDKRVELSVWSSGIAMVDMKVVHSVVVKDASMACRWVVVKDLNAAAARAD